MGQQLRALPSSACTPWPNPPVHLLTFRLSIPYLAHNGGRTPRETLANDMFFYLLQPFVLTFAASTRLAGRRAPLIGAVGRR